MGQNKKMQVTLTCLNQRKSGNKDLCTKIFKKKKTKPSEKTICMNNSTCDPKKISHYERHKFFTDFEVLKEEDDAHYLCRNY